RPAYFRSSTTTSVPSVNVPAYRSLVVATVWTFNVVPGCCNLTTLRSGGASGEPGNGPVACDGALAILTILSGDDADARSIASRPRWPLSSGPPASSNALYAGPRS